MSSSRIDPESSEGKILEGVIQNQIATFGLDDDPEFVARYIVVMICNHKPNNEIASELSDLFGNKFPEGFAEWAYNALEQVVSGQSSGAPANEEKPSVSFTAEQPLKSGGLFARIDKSKLGNSGSSVNKGSKKDNSKLGKLLDPSALLNQAQQNPDGNGEDESMDGTDNGSNDQHSYTDGSEIRIRVHNKQRCRHWPNCNMKGCRFGHPTAPCRYGPQCQMVKGTCPYLHEEDTAKGFFPKNMRFNPNNNMGGGLPPMPFPMNMNMPMPMFGQQGGGFAGQPPFVPEPQIALCKFKEKCANKDCKFAHPTPANSQASVIEYIWCPDKEKCENPECLKAHPSASLVRDPEPIEVANHLEACKFGNRCTNPRCKFRHATSTVICRNGSECTRPDCFFSHPINEPCKFGVNCGKPNCLFQHPEGRDAIVAQGGPKLTWRRQDQEHAQEQEQGQGQQMQEVTEPAFAAVENGA